MAVLMFSLPHERLVVAGVGDVGRQVGGSGSWLSAVVVVGLPVHTEMAFNKPPRRAETRGDMTKEHQSH